MKTFSGNFMGMTLRKASAFMLSLIMVFMPLSDYMSPLVVKAAETINIRTRNDGAAGYSGYEEGAYVEWQPVTGADGYIVYVSGDAGNNWTAIDDELIRYYQTNGERYYRADALGLKAGAYQLKVAAVTLNADNAVKETLVEWTGDVTVSAHDRSGYAWVNGKTTGAYNEDGTLREDAEVVYITNANKDTVTAIGKTGFGNIMNSYKSAQTKSLAVRIIGNIDDPDNLTQGDLAFENNKNGAYGITIEGVGEDAVANGWGIALKNASNVEVRNIAFMNCDSKEGDNVSLVSDNDHIWVHNCDMFYGEAGNDEDQKKGDGALDCKVSSYVTFSYNHFWDSGKCCLLGLGDENNKDYFITYHHNWFDHSDSRHPRVRFYTAHVYNNYYDGNSKYGIGGALGGGSIFAENNYFRNCKYPMLISMQGNDTSSTFSGEDGSMIKAYGNIMEDKYSFMPYGADEIVQNGVTVSKGNIDTTVEFDAYVAQERNEKVPEEVKTTTKASFKQGNGGNTYNNFDTAEDFYAYTADDAAKVPEIVKAHAGRINGGDLKWTFDNDTEDSNYSIIADLKAAVTEYKSDLVMVGGIKQAPMVTLYLVTFDPNNGESTYDVYVKEGDILTMPETPAMPEGKVSLDGWYNSNKKWNFENPVTAGMTLKAIWLAEGEESWDKIYPIGAERVTHIIATSTGDLFSHYFNINGSIYKSGQSAPYEGVNDGKNIAGRYLRFDDEGDNISFTTLTKSKLVLQLTYGSDKNLMIDGKKYTAVNGIIEIAELAAGEHTINYANSTADLYAITVIPDATIYTVTFDTQGGSTVEPQSVLEGLKCTRPETQKEGYVVYAWYTDAECTKEYDFDTPVTGDITLYAKWAQKRTVTFDTQGGTAVDAQEVADGAVCIQPVTVRTGYVFDGWYTDAQYKTAYDFSSPVTEDITLYAKWTALYTVTFDAKGGTPVGTQTVMSGTVCTEPVTEREGYVFAGWYTDETFNKKYNFKTPVTSDITLYARWRTQDETDNEMGMKVVLLDSDDGGYVYTGSPIKPEIRVTNNGELLTEGKDYTVKYSNNTNVSTDAKPASLVVKGKGNFSGTSTPVNFKITKKDIAEVEYPKVMTVAENAKVAPIMMNGAKKLGAKDYVLKGNGLTNGKYAKANTYNLEVQGQGNYGGTINITVMVVTKAAMQKFKVNVEGSVNLDLHDATKQTPEALVEQNIIKITDAKTGKPLTAGDYEIVCSSDTTNAGTVKFTVIGKGIYGGSVAKSYNINPIKAQKASFDIPANVTAEFNAAGSVPKDFKMFYKEKTVSDGVTKEYLLELDQGVDYKIAYSSNKKAGKGMGKYTITFLGNFKGSETIKGVYDISPTELKLNDNTEIVIPDKVYKKAGSAYKSTPIVTVDGVTLKSSNYTVKSYSWKAESGDKYQDGNKVTLGEKDNYAEVKVTIVPKNDNYTVAADEELTGTYYVRKLPTGAEDLSKAKVVFKDKKGTILKNLNYNGKAYFTPEGNNPADEVSDNAENAVYVEVSVKGVIVDRSLYKVEWTNSTLKGKAAVVISGTGETGANGKSAVGSKNASISIKAMDLKKTTFLKEFLSMLGM